MFRLPLKLILYLGYLVAVAVIAGTLVYRARRFEGTVIIERGRAEHWAVRPASKEGGLFAFANRGMPAEVIGFDNPRAVMTLLDGRDSYVPVELPFTLALKNVEVLQEGPMLDELEALHSGERFPLNATVGMTTDIPEGKLRVLAVEPWAGLVRDPRGTPLALAVVRKDGQDWQPPVFIAPERAARPLPGVLIKFRTYPNETAAREALPQKAPPARALRWGVHEDKRIHWFDGLTPGTGVTTAYGTEYTLLDADANGDRIRVERKHASGTVVETVAANGDSKDGLITFERHDNEIVILLHAWRDGAALAAPWVAGERQPEQLVNEGNTLSVKGPGNAMLELRLDQALLRAVPVPPLPDGPKALVLDTPAGVLRLREGMSGQVKETRLIYRRRREAPQVRYALRASFGKKQPAVEFTLDPGGKKRIEGWQVVHDQDNPEAARLAALRVRRIPISFGQYLAALLFFAGAAGLLVVRFGVRRPLPAEALPFEPDQGWTAVTDTPPPESPGDDEDNSVIAQTPPREEN